MKTFKNLIFIVFVINVFCAQEKTPLNYVSEGQFAIYLAKENVQPGTELEKIELIQKPLLTSSTIKNYYWNEHKITYTNAVLTDLQNWGDLLGRIFVVSVGSERIYWGFFLSDHFSSSWQLPVVRLYPDVDTSKFLISESLIIERAYPAYWGPEDEPDPRVNAKIFYCLLNSGKIVTK